MIKAWKIIPGYNNYEISDWGDVRNRSTGLVLKPGKKKLYLYVNLGRNNSKRIHRLVARAFLGLSPMGQVVLHRDGNHHNNHLSNLEYGTLSENAKDITRHNRRKLTIAQIHDIRARFKEAKHGFITQTAREFGVSVNTIYRLLNGEHYSHV